MKKEEGLAMLNRELAERKAMVKRGENVNEAKEAIRLIEKKIAAVNKFVV